MNNYVWTSSSIKPRECNSDLFNSGSQIYKTSINESLNTHMEIEHLTSLIIVETER